jgi:ornithine cyclodeaminase/alanine dehydrogenase-like protein (mu-crystallin family)
MPADMTNRLLWISEADVEALLDPVALMSAAAEGFAAVARGETVEPAPTRMNGLDGAEAYISVFPAHAERGLASVKVLAGRPANAGEGRPEIDAIVSLADPASGRIVALIAARALTAYRTAAATALVLARLLHRKPARIGLIGTGAQAKAHLRLLAETGVGDAFKVASPLGGLARAQALVAAAGGAAASHDIVACPLSELARSSDALIFMTLAKEPIEPGQLPDDCAIASIGTFYPHAHEIDPVWLASASIVVSDDPVRLQRQWEATGLIDFDRVRLISVTDLLADGFEPPGTGLRIFLSDGRGFEDNVAATLIYHAALAAGRGLRLP